MSVVAAERVETSIQIRLKILKPKTVMPVETISASAEAQIYPSQRSDLRASLDVFREKGVVIKMVTMGAI